MNIGLPLLAVSAACKNLDFTNFGNVGSCFIDGVFFGDVMLASIIIFILFVALTVRYNFPVTMMIPVGIALAYTMWLMSGADIFMGLLLLPVVIGGAVLILAILQYLNR